MNYIETFLLTIFRLAEPGELEYENLQKDRFQIVILIVCKFKQIDQLLFPVKSFKNF